MYELYARLTVKKLEEIAVQGDARAQFLWAIKMIIRR